MKTDYHHRVTPERITALKDSEVFVFGSNLNGWHGGGAARAAMLHFGAEWGKGEGPQGRSYAIPTMQGGVETIAPYVERFIRYARRHPEQTFLVTPIGCGIAGFSPREIAPLFREAVDVENIHLPNDFWEQLVQPKTETTRPQQHNKHMKSESHYFSPTKGGEKIAKAIARGLEGDDKSDITPAVFVTPVYSGHMPGAAKERFKNIKAKGNQPAILVAVYGNRAFEQALTDLETFIKERGYTPVAAAAFVCEHSYSTPETPIAAGRPDRADLERAEAFGRAVRERLLRGDLTPVNVSALRDEPSPRENVRRFVEAVTQVRASMATHPVPRFPQYSERDCTGCGICAAACPMGAIGEDLSLDPARCIVCCACVKACPTGARAYRSPLAQALSENFSERKEPRWLV